MKDEVCCIPKIHFVSSSMRLSLQVDAEYAVSLFGFIKSEILASSWVVES